MNGTSSAAFAVMALLALVQQSFAGDGNPARGQRIFQACASCHNMSFFAELNVRTSRRPPD